MPKIIVSAGTFFSMALCCLLLPFRWLISFFIAAIVHELGHLAAVALCGGKLCRVTVHGFGAVMECAPQCEIYNLICILSGPAFSFLLLGLGRYAPRVALCGLLQGLFNLLPLPFLDGGRAIRVILAILRDGRSDYTKKKKLAKNRD